MWFVPALLLTAMLAVSCARLTNDIRITNQSGAAIAVVVVTLNGTAYELKDIPDGKARSTHFSVRHDGSFQVEVTWADGTVKAGRFGYVTGGAGAYGNQVRITITKDREIVGTQK